MGHRSAIFLAAAAVCALLSCDGRPRVARHGAPRNGPTIAVLDLSDGVPEQLPTGILGLPSRGAAMEDLVEETELLAEDNPPRGVLVRLGTARIGFARALEVGALLERIGRKLPVWCHADELNNATLYVVARGCKRVWASPAGSVDAIGLAAQLVYFHKLLAETLGLQVDFLQVGKYKGAEEPFTRDGPSPEARASLESTLADMRAAWVEGIRAARGSTEEVALEDGPYSASGAKALGLVDDVGYFDDARDALEKEAGASRAEVKLGAGSPSGAGDDLGDLVRMATGDALAAAPVVVVTVAGAISMDGTGVVGEGGGISERRLLPMLVRLEKDDDVKAVVLRIDSPGGSALASDLLWHQLMRVRAAKPLVVSVGDMAASGGYYLASAGSVVFADAASIVGSIGVVGGKIAAGHALEKLGVHGDTVPAKTGDPTAASRAAYESLLVPWDEPTRRRLLETMTGIYDLFVSRVAEGRGISAARVALSAEGRIFSGRDAKGRGLVDELGGLGDAIVRARALAGLPPTARVGAAGASRGLLQALVEDDPQSRAPPDILGRAIAGVAPELVSFMASLAPLSSHEGGREGVLCALPFALTIR